MVTRNVSALGLMVLASSWSGLEAQSTVTGVVRAASIPRATMPDMSSDLWCVANPGPMRAPGLGETIVYVVDAPADATTGDPVTLDQSGCQYRPGMIGLHTGQDLIIRNSDETLHNVHVTPMNNRGFNIGQPLRGLQSKRMFDMPEDAVPVKCDIHGWMSGYLFIFDHGLYAVADAEGAFTLPPLPQGTWTVRAWNAVLGSAEIQVTANGQPLRVELSLQK